MTGTAPRITKEDIENNIVAEHYFTARQGAVAADQERGVDGVYHQSLGLLTFCVLVLRNGFTVVGKNACVSPENFNADIGRQVAREDAIDEIWPLMGYELRSKVVAAEIGQEQAA